MTEPIKRKLIHSFQPSHMSATAKVYSPKLNTHVNASAKASAKASAPVVLNTFTIRPVMASILNQGDLGDCVSNAYALAISTITKGPKQVNMSRLYNYALARCNTGGSVTNDSGIYAVDAADAISKYGICQESMWPYIPIDFTLLPPMTAFQGSKFLKGFAAIKVTQDLAHLQSCLTTQKKPIIFGFMVYSSFMTDAVTKNGIVPMPNTTTENLEGGHCACIIGYDNTHKWFICANSWGTGWGDKGYFYMPYDYVINANLANDFYYLSFTF